MTRLYSGPGADPSWNVSTLNSSCKALALYFSSAQAPEIALLEGRIEDASDEHEFVVIDVERIEDQIVDGIAIRLTDARGGRVRLHLSGDMAELLHKRVSAALDKRKRV